MKKSSIYQLKELAYFSSIGLSFVISIFLGLFFGRYLDNVFNTHPWLMFLFLMLGIAAGFRNIFLAIKKTS
ncbi:MAG: AtpZ/AtpI family protein [Desulfobacterales bacterium]|nr:AtpZ/AtpI family protein [Desulfobacterales bacterium]